MTGRPLLVVEHQASCPPGWLGEWLTAAGLALDIRRPYAADGAHRGLPAGLDGHAGVVVLGGSMAATDDDTVAWLAPVKALIREAAARGVPVLGVCLGHQVAATALGGQVAPNPRGQTLGLQSVRWTPAAAADPLTARIAADGASAEAVQWNDDIVVVAPGGSVELARAVTGELLAARFAPSVWGVQWHPEAHADLLAPWAEKDRARVAARGDDVDRQVARIRAAQPRLRHTWSLLGAGFATAVAAAERG